MASKNLENLADGVYSLRGVAGAGNFMFLLSLPYHCLCANDSQPPAWKFHRPESDKWSM